MFGSGFEPVGRGRDFADRIVRLCDPFGECAAFARCRSTRIGALEVPDGIDVRVRVRGIVAAASVPFMGERSVVASPRVVGDQDGFSISLDENLCDACV